MKAVEQRDALRGGWRGPGTRTLESGSLVCANPERTAQALRWSDRLRIAVSTSRRFLRVRLRGSVLEGSGASLHVQVGLVRHEPIPLDSETFIEVRGSRAVRLGLEVNGRTTVRIDQLELTVVEEPPLPFDAETGGTALITPTYPSSCNLYASAFVHARVAAYRARGLQPLVVCIDPRIGYQQTYEFEGVKILRGNPDDLAHLLSVRRFDKLLVHFFDERFAHAIDRSLLNHSTETILWCHGPETLFGEMPAVVAPYGHVPRDAGPVSNGALDDCVRRYAFKRNVQWVFVSDWLRRRSEEALGLRFERGHVIPNPVDPELFPFRPRTPEQRNRIVVVRRYDNERKYGVDIAVGAIQELSRRPGFSQLQIDFYGDGDHFHALLDPLERFPNVRLHQGFLSRAELGELFARSGIALFPTRHDTQGLAACEAAAAGLAVVSSKVTAVPEFLAEDAGTLVAGERASDYADVIERLTREPTHFAAAGQLLSARVRERCSPQNTVERELTLIRSPASVAEATTRPAAGGAPTLTVLVPVYNMERLLERCVASMLEGVRDAAVEILLVDDGSTDGSWDLATALERAHEGRVRAIRKANGGHGSTVNRGLAEARGRYFRVVDSDDWVDARAFHEFVSCLESEEADVVLTDVSEDRVGKPLPIPKRSYSNLTPGRLYRFDDLAADPGGFAGWGPTLAAGTFKTECLRRAQLRLDEGCAYVDMEYSVLSLTYIETLRYYRLDVYRYYLGRQDQSVSRAGFERRYKDHEKVIFRLCDYLRDTPQLSQAKRRYVVRNVLASLIDAHHLILMDWRNSPQECRAFDRTLGQYPFLAPLRIEARRRSPAARLALETGRVAKRALRDLAPELDLDDGLSGAVRSAARIALPHLPHPVRRALRSSRRLYRLRRRDA